jgi:hypothetical protein
LFGCVGLVSGSGFLEDGQEYVYQEWGIQNAGTMDYSPSAAGISWKSTVRIQVSPHHPLDTPRGNLRETIGI